MQYCNFPDFLRERYNACIRVSFEEGIETRFPSVVSTFTEAWQRVVNLRTCPFHFRLELLEALPTSHDMINRIDDLAHVEADPSNPSDPPDLLWFKYWMNLFFNLDQMPSYLFLDIPVCCIHVSSSPVKVQQKFPAWAQPYTKDICTYNIIVVDTPEQVQRGAYFCVNGCIDNFYDAILNITHYHAAHTLRKLKEDTTQFVNDNWHGFSNSVRRLLGFGGRVSRETVILELKRLGDICLSCGEYEEAFNYYQQLYDEYTDDDPKVEDSLLITMAVTSILSTDELDIIELLKPTLVEKGQGYHFYQCMFITSFYAATHNNLTYARRIFVHISKRITKSHHPFSVVAYPLLNEAASFCSNHGKGTIYLYKASNAYKHIHLLHNEKICLWRLYHRIKGTGWPQLEQYILLTISNTGDIPIELHHHLVNRSIVRIEETIKIINQMEITDPVNIGSIVCHDVFVHATGFPMSPPPKGVSQCDWVNMRKRLFPIAYHPSTDRFTASAWGNDTLEITNIAVGEEGIVHFRLLPSPTGKCRITNLKLIIDDESAAVSEVLESIELKQQVEVEMKFTPLKAAPIIIRGVKFIWNGVTPAVVLFGETLKFESISNTSVVELSVESNRSETFPDHSIEFKLKTHRVSGQLSSLNVVINSLVDVSMTGSKQNGAQIRWTLNHENIDNEATFNVFPTARDIGKNHIDIFISFTTKDSHVTRFAYQPFDFVCKEFPKISALTGNKTVILRSCAPINEIVCNNANIECSGDKIKVISSNEKREKEAILKVTRNASGINALTDIKIQDVYMTINAPDTVKPKSYPAFIDVKLEFVMLCDDIERKVILEKPQGTDWIWTGKNVFFINKPKQVCDVKILVFKPFTSNIGQRINIDNSRKFDKMISVI